MVNLRGSADKVQYNVPISLRGVTNGTMQQYLQPYSQTFTDRSGNLDSTCFSRETHPTYGEVIIFKTLHKAAPPVVRRVLGGIDGIFVHPTEECSWEEDKEKVRLGHLVTN